MLIGINVNKSFIILVLMIIVHYFIPYIVPFSEALGKSSMLVFFIIELILSKDNIKKETDTLNIIYYQYNQIIEEDNNNNCKRIKMIILILVCLVFQSVYFFYSIEKYTDVLAMTCFILLLTDKIIFNRNIYSHQILAIILTFIAFIISLIDILIVESMKLILLSFLHSFFLLEIKEINIQYFISIYFLWGLIGLNNLICLLFFDRFEKEYLFLLKFYLILCYDIIYNYLYCRIIMKYSPKHSFFMELSIRTIASLIRYCLNHGFKLEDLIYYFFLFVSIFSGLIYLEILELNFCGLNKNLEKNIQIRATIKNPELDFNEISTDSVE